MKYQCPCCGYFTFPVPAKEDYGYICPVCFWENDKFIHSEEESSDCNHGLNLIKARDNFSNIGACEEAMVKNVRPPMEDEYVKAVMIGAGSEAVHTIQKAHRCGIHITALDGNPQAEGLAAADRAIVVDISDREATIEAARNVMPDFLLTAPIGRYLTTIGAVNDALHLPGISERMAVLCTDKFSFHEILSSQGLRSCNCYKVGFDDKGELMVAGNGKVYGKGLKDMRQLDELVLGFPAVLKPRYGSGSRGIHILNDKEAMLAAIKSLEGEAHVVEARIASEEYVLEECIAGEEYGIDGAVIEGNFYLVLLRKKENTPPPARQAVGYYSVQPADPFWQQVKAYLEKVIQCLGLQECLLHADLIRSERGPFVIELSARPSGHNLHNLFTPLCTGVDMAEEYMKHRLGLPCCFVPKETKSMLIHYFDMEGMVSHVPDQEEVSRIMGDFLVEWMCNIREGEVLAPVSDGHSLMGRGYFILKATGENAAEQEAVLAENAQAVKKLFFQGLQLQ